MESIASFFPLRKISVKRFKKKGQFLEEKKKKKLEEQCKKCGGVLFHNVFRFRSFILYFKQAITMLRMVLLGYAYSLPLLFL